MDVGSELGELRRMPLDGVSHGKSGREAIRRFTQKSAIDALLEDSQGWVPRGASFVSRLRRLVYALS